MSSEEQKGRGPDRELAPEKPENPGAEQADEPSSASEVTHVSHEQTTDADHDSHYYDGYTYDDPYSQVAQGPVAPAAAVAPVASGTGSTPPPASPAKGDDEDEEDDGMLRMSFLEHLEELRSRLIKALGGVAVAFLLSMIFANEIWKAISDPAAEALARLGYPPTLKQLSPTDAFTVIWMKVPLLTATFLSSPWILYQVWSFIAPGLYKKERRFAAPFILCTAGLFVMGGLFAYFVAFRFGLEFLLGMGKDINVEPAINLVDYFDLFVNVSLGIGLVFEMPVAVFFLTFLRITTAKFLLANSRYAILIIVILAAVVTPTPDIFNLMIFSVPMVFLYFIGVFASYLLELRRNDESFPWASVLVIISSLVAVVGAVLYLAVTRYGYKLIPYWPFLVR